MILRNLKIYGALSDIEIKDGKIVCVEPHIDGEGVDFGGAVAIPGLVDIHSHGCVGGDTMDGEFAEMCDFLAKNGTTSWLPTTMTMDYDSIKRAVSGNTDVPGTNIIGFHMEGPYISPKYKGAQNEKFIKSPDIDEFNSLPGFKMVTIAPELEGSMDFIRECKAVVSLGHTACDYDTAIEAIEAGAQCLTHTFNAMPAIHHRNPGPICAGAEKGIYAQVICDGLHIHKSAILLLYKVFGRERMVLISDSMRATGLSDGEYEFGGQPIQVVNGVARTLDGAIAGSTSTLWFCVKKAIEFGIPAEDAVYMATEVPARLIGADTKGRIAAGCDADILILDDNFELDRVMICGEFYK